MLSSAIFFKMLVEFHKFQDGLKVLVGEFTRPILLGLTAILELRTLDEENITPPEAFESLQSFGKNFAGFPFPWCVAGCEARVGS